jgi:DNA modification methylase
MKEIDEIYDNLYCGKWEDLILTIPDNSIDLIVTSPPYNVNLGKNKLKKDKYDTYDDNMPYEDYLEWMTKLFTECNRILKYGGRLVINIGDGANGRIPTHVDFTNILVNKLNLKDEWFKQFKMITTIVWDKNQIGASTAWGSWKSPSDPSFPTQFEFIIIVGKGTTKHQGSGEVSVSSENFIRNSRALWTFTPETGMMKNYDHPAMFPSELPKRCIDQLTYIGDVVLDPFSGAGTTCAVAKKMGRHYIGFEMSEKYHNKATERLSLIPTVGKGGFSEWMM